MKRVLLVLGIFCLGSSVSARVIELGTDGIGPTGSLASSGQRGVNSVFQILDGATTTITNGRAGGNLSYNYNLSPFGDLVDGGSGGSIGRSNMAYTATDDPWIVVDKNFIGQPTLEGPNYSTAVDPANPPSWAAKGIGVHANGGVTFDLNYFRGKPEFETTANQAFVLRGRSGANDFKRSGTVSTSVLVDGAVQYVTPKLNVSQPTQPFEIGLPASARYLTIGATSGGDGITCDHAVFENIILEPVNVAPSTQFYRARADAAADEQITGIYWSDAPNSLGAPVSGAFGGYASATNVAIFDPIAQVLETGHTYYLTVAANNSGGGPGGLRATFHFDKGFLETGGLTDLNTNLTNWMVSTTAPGPDAVWEPAWAAPVAAGWYTGTGGISSDAAWIWHDISGTYAPGTVYLRAALTPLPEPTSLVLLTLGGLGATWGLRRRKVARG